MKQNMTTGSPMSIILRFMIPLFIGNLFQQIYNTVDTIIVGRYLGENALAAVGSTGTLMFVIIGFANGLCTGFTVLTSQKFGEGNLNGTRRSVATGSLLSVIVAVILTVLFLGPMAQILHLMNTPEEIFDDAYRYISVICMGIAANVAYNYLASCMRAIGNSKVPLVMLAISSVLNILLDLVLICLTPLGVAGAAWATVIAQAISAVLSLIYIIKKEPVLTPDRSMFRLWKSDVKSQMAAGIPMALQFAITGSGTVIMQAAFNLFGATAVAAYSAASKITSLLIQGPIAIGQTMAAYAGQNFGAGKFDRIRKGVRASLILYVVYSIGVGIIAYVGLPVFMQLFFNSEANMEAMMEYARTYMGISVLFYVPLSVIFNFRNTMQGCGYGFLPMMGGVVELIARLIFAFVAMRTMSYVLACLCDPAAWLAAGVFTGVSYLFVIKKIERIHRPAETAV